MEGKAKSRYVRGSARKMRRVAALVKGMPVDRAAAVLKALPKSAATPLAKVIQSAAANALAIEGTAHHKMADFIVTDVRIDGGPIARRFRPTGMGRAYRIRKRFCHVSVVVSDEPMQEKRAKVAVKAAPKAEAATAKTASAKPASTAKKSAAKSKKSTKDSGA